MKTVEINFKQFRKELKKLEDKEEDNHIIKTDSIVWSSDKIHTEEDINKNIEKINKKYNVFDEKEAGNECDN